jgi:hypothetical protein
MQYKIENNIQQQESQPDLLCIGSDSTKWFKSLCVMAMKSTDILECEQLCLSLLHAVFEYTSYHSEPLLMWLQLIWMSHKTTVNTGSRCFKRHMKYKKKGWLQQEDISECVKGSRRDLNNAWKYPRLEAGGMWPWISASDSVRNCCNGILYLF